MRSMSIAIADELRSSYLIAAQRRLTRFNPLTNGRLKRPSARYQSGACEGYHYLRLRLPTLTCQYLARLI